MLISVSSFLELKCYVIRDSGCFISQRHPSIYTLALRLNYHSTLVLCNSSKFPIYVVHLPYKHMLLFSYILQTQRNISDITRGGSLDYVYPIFTNYLERSRSEN